MMAEALALKKGLFFVFSFVGGGVGGGWFEEKGEWNELPV